MKVVSVNNILVRSAAEATKAIEQSGNVVTILAHSPGYYGSTETLVTVTVTKERPQQNVGVQFATNALGKVEVKSVTKSSLLDNTDLVPGMQVVAINSSPVQSVAHAVQLTLDAFPVVTLLTQRTSVSVTAGEEGESEVYL